MVVGKLYTILLFFIIQLKIVCGDSHVGESGFGWHTDFIILEFLI